MQAKKVKNDYIRNYQATKSSYSFIFNFKGAWIIFDGRLWWEFEYLQSKLVKNQSKINVKHTKYNRKTFEYPIDQGI